MSLQYLLDGYNILHQMRDWERMKLEDQREEFIRLIERFSPQGSRRNKITVVFDGKPGYYVTKSTASVQVIFTFDETADDRIKEITEEAENSKNILVVSDDRNLQYAVKALGAKVESVTNFLARLTVKKSVKKPGSPKKTGNEKDISKSLEMNINSELSDIWLRKKK